MNFACVSFCCDKYKLNGYASLHVLGALYTECHLVQGRARPAACPCSRTRQVYDEPEGRRWRVKLSYGIIIPLPPLQPKVGRACSLCQPWAGRGLGQPWASWGSRGGPKASIPGWPLGEARVRPGPALGWRSSGVCGALAVWGGGGAWGVTCPLLGHGLPTCGAGRGWLWSPSPPPPNAPMGEAAHPRSLLKSSQTTPGRVRKIHRHRPLGLGGGGALHSEGR